MRDFFDFIIEPFNDGFWGIVIGLIMLFTITFFIGLILYGGFYCTDSAFLDIKKGQGVLVDKWYSRPYTTTSMIMSGNVVIPIITHHPESWDLELKIKNQKDVISVNKQFWDKNNIGQILDCNYKKGRLSNFLYIDKCL